ncbi:AsmA family protein [Trichlorobacter sp.]|uniref:AsmA family protein n=1 Tax=Trichlorobacter sp. TaxID=2911007 RepID=UPI002A36024E|nr:AsmA family protein [Trichlorobacter sp.]MDY0385005.1 AsmA family protein [Trichlorobacter sp.]
MNRQKLLKIAGVSAGIVVALLVGLTILVKLIISPELVKKTVLPKISAAINRQVSLGDVSVSIFSGIRLHDLVVLDREGSEPFVKAGAIRLDYRFWPLLRKRVEIEQIRLESPLVRVVRNADGSFNFSDLLVKKQPPAAPAEPKAKSPIDLSVSEVVVSDGRLIFDDRKGLGGKPYQAEISAIQFSAQQISLDGTFPISLQAALPGGMQFDLSGTATAVGSGPTVALAARLIAKDLSKLAAGLPPSLAEKITRFDLAGGMELNLKLAGATKQPKELLQGGEITLNAMQLTAGGQRPSIGGQLLLGKDSLESKGLTLTVKEQKLAIGLKAANLLAKPIKLSVAVSGDTLDLNKLLPAKAKATAAPAGSTALAGPSAAPKAVAKPEPGPLNLPLVANGTVTLNSLLFRTLTISKPSLSWRLADNLLTVDSLKGGLAGGSFSDTARVNLGVKGFSYSTQLTVQGVQADQLVSAFAPKASGSTFGSMVLTAQLQGSGTQPEAIKRNLGGNGSFAISDGKLTGSGFMPQLASYLKADALRILRFSRYAGDFAIKGGIVTLNSALDGSDAKFKTSGTAGFDKSIAMGLDLRLSPAITGQVVRGSAGRFLTDSQGWGILPLKVVGTVGSPRFTLDSAQAGEHLKGKLQEELSRRLLKDKQGQPRPEKQLLEQGLKGLFGR